MSKYLVLRAGVCWSRGQLGAPACWQWHTTYSLGRVLLLLWAGLMPYHSAMLLGRKAKVVLGSQHLHWFAEYA